MPPLIDGGKLRRVAQTRNYARRSLTA